MILWLKDCLTEKNASRNGKVNLTKTEIVFIVVHLKSGHYLTVVQRFKVAFIQEIWFTHTGDRGDSLCIRETPALSLGVGMYDVIQFVCINVGWVFTPY